MVIDGVEVWEASLEVTASHLTRLLSLLAVDEVERANRYRFAADRRRYIVARATLRLLLSGCLDYDPAMIGFRYGTHGKPALVDFCDADPLYFNLSHSGDRALIAITRLGEVGVDLEQTRLDIPIEDIAAHYFTPEEATTLSLLPVAERHERFFVYWTRKEAYSKARGLGLSLDPRRIDAALPTERSSQPFLLRVDATTDPAFAVCDLEVRGGYAGALAVAGGFAAVTMKEFMAD